MPAAGVVSIMMQSGSACSASRMMRWRCRRWLGGTFGESDKAGPCWCDMRATYENLIALRVQYLFWRAYI
jgi:hypothetical protein